MSKVIYERHLVTLLQCELPLLFCNNELTACSALIGFLISLSPLSCDLMGFRGAGGNGAAST